MRFIVFAIFVPLVGFAFFSAAAKDKRHSPTTWTWLGVLVYLVATLSAEFFLSLFSASYLIPLIATLQMGVACEGGFLLNLAVHAIAHSTVLAPVFVGFFASSATLGALRRNRDASFLVVFWVIGYFYLFMLGAMLLADAFYTTPDHLLSALNTKPIRYAIGLSLKSCTLAAILSVWVAVPIGYVMSRFQFRGKGILDALLDIPIVLPPLVVGLSLLVLFNTPMGVLWEDNIFPVTYQVPSVVLAQFMVACAFAVRTMRATFEQINERQEQVAMTLGCTRAQAFWRVVLPEARNGVITAGTLAWARSLGEFGPILVFSGATRMRTEVLPTTVYLEMTTGNLEAAVAVSLIMVVVAVIVLFLVRRLGSDPALSRVL